MNANACNRYTTAPGRLGNKLARSLDGALFVLLSALLTLAAATSFVEGSTSPAADAVAAKPAATVLAANRAASAAGARQNR